MIIVLYIKSKIESLKGKKINNYITYCSSNSLLFEALQGVDIKNYLI